MNPKDDMIEIDLVQLARALWRRAWAVVLAMLLFGAAAFSWAFFFVTPLYQANAMLYVNNSSLSVGSTTVSLSDLSAAQSLVDTYIVILKTRTTLEEVIARADLNYSYEELYDMIEAEAVNSTEVFEIVVTSPDPRGAEKIANVIAELLPERISDIVEGSSVRIVDSAVVPSKKSSPSISRYTAIGLLLGMAVSCGVIVLLELLDDQIRDEDYLLQTYDLPMLAVVPDLLASPRGSGRNYSSYGSKKEKPPLQSGKKSASLPDQWETLGEHLSFAASEAYKLLRTNLMFALPDEQKCRVVGLTSAERGEGKSTTTINLAYSLAQMGKRVLVVEADMRLPTISKRLALGSPKGLSNLLAGLSNGADIIQASGLHENFWVISAGDIPPNPSELLGSEQMRAAIESLGKDFDFILLDLPPVNAVSDPLVVSGLVGGMILVVRQNDSRRRSLAEAMRQLKFAGVKLLGFVMNGSDTAVKGQKRYRKKYGYNYDYGYGKRQMGSGKTV